MADLYRIRKKFTSIPHEVIIRLRVEVQTEPIPKKAPGFIGDDEALLLKEIGELNNKLFDQVKDKTSYLLFSELQQLLKGP